MRGGRLFILIAVPFVIACAIALWLTRPMPAVVTGEPPPPAIAPAQNVIPRDPAAAAAPRVIAVAPADETPQPPPEVREPPRTATTPPAQWPEQLRTGGATTTAGPPPTATTDEEPPVSKEDVQRAIRSVTPLIRECFMDAAEKNPGDHRVVLRFTIVGQGTSGRMDEGEIVDSTIADPWAQACFLESLTDAQFPAPSGGGTVTVTYPFNFTRGRDAGTNPPPTGNAAE